MVKLENSKIQVLTCNFSDSPNIMTLQGLYASPIFLIMRFFQLSSIIPFFPNPLIITTLRVLHDSPIFLFSHSPIIMTLRVLHNSKIFLIVRFCSNDFSIYSTNLYG